MKSGFVAIILRFLAQLWKIFLGVIGCIKRTMQQNGEARPTRQGKVIAVLMFVGRLLLNAMLKLWAFCTAALLLLLLLYWMYGTLPAFILLTFAVIGFLYNAQDVLLYYPDQPPQSRLYVESPVLFGMPYENIYHKTQDGVRINMQFIPRPEDQKPNAPTLVYFHGNAGNIGHRLTNVYVLYIYLGFNVLSVEYRGYGKSGGTPCEQGLYLDAAAAMDYLLTRTDINLNKILVFGRSLGGAVATNLAAHPVYSHNICALILENTFTSLPDIGRTLFNFQVVNSLPDWCFKNQYPSMELVKQIKTPTLFISGQADALIPPPMMESLHAASNSIFKKIVRFEGGTHNETWRSAGYYDAFKKFLAEVYKIPTKKRERAGSQSFVAEMPFDDGATGTVKAL
ncbi:protein ABHD13-like [Lineus longissimus]|uniref:protein ABHD13-like n=1 Tax=Lineus longissimus TaxID=88925 RepID=UPI002B4CEA79